MIPGRKGGGGGGGGKGRERMATPRGGDEGPGSPRGSGGARVENNIYNI